MNGNCAKCVCMCVHVVPVAYTDVDYLVYSEASQHVLSGASPFDRATYRYTPLLSWLMMPCHLLHSSFGKLMFILSDLLLAYLLYRIFTLQLIEKRLALLYTSTWLFNPFSFTISSRGNADVLICLMVIATIYCFLTKRLYLGSFL